MATVSRYGMCYDPARLARSGFGGNVIMLIRCMYTLVVFCILLPGCASAVNKSDLCLQDETALTCLRDNFDELYTQNYRRFWNIAHQAASDARKCDSPANTVAFLYLARIKTNNAEFNEFFSEVIERLVTEKPHCFLAAVATMDLSSQKLVMEKLRNPIFAESAAIENALRAESNEKYKSIVDLYFELQKW